MASLEETIVLVRKAVGAVMKIRKVEDERVVGGTVVPARFEVGFVGTAFGIVENRYLVTAFHVFNEEKPRLPQDKFYVWTVPDNGPVAYSSPVVGFPLEDPDFDFAVIEVRLPAKGGQTIAALPFTSQRPPDGTRVLTYGFPSPTINKVGNLDRTGNYLGGGQIRTD